MRRDRRVRNGSGLIRSIGGLRYRSRQAYDAVFVITEMAPPIMGANDDVVPTGPTLIMVPCRFDPIPILESAIS